MSMPLAKSHDRQTSEIPTAYMATMGEHRPRRPKPVFWVASSKKDLRGFPHRVRRTFGRALFDAQAGGKHPDARPLKRFKGAGVLEVVEDDEGNTYRAIYTVRVAGVVCVLHVFQKKSKTGVKTPPEDIENVKTRLKEAEKNCGQWVERKRKERNRCQWTRSR
jgi:phage-related protein